MVQLSATALILLCAPRAWADQAILIGLDEYSNIDKEAGLAGCLNDLVLMEKILIVDGFEASGFKKLENKEATKQGIGAAFDKLKLRKERERLVVYYSGHGRAYPDSGLLTYKSQQAASKEDITIDEMEAFLKGASKKGFRVTVILDSCFSGLIVRSTRARSKVFSQVGKKDTILVTPLVLQRLKEEERLAKLEGGAICYVAACLPLESAREVSLDGDAVKAMGLRSADQLKIDSRSKASHFGLFTLNLYNQVMKYGTEQAWQTLMTGVAESISLSSFESIQTPIYSPRFWDYRVFHNTKMSDVPPNPKLLAKIQEQYEVDSRLTLRIIPDGASETDKDLEAAHVGQPFRIAFDVKDPGRFHVVIEYDGKKFKRMYPEGNDAIAEPAGVCYVKNKNGLVWAFTSPSDEQVIVFSFDDKAKAQEMINSLPFAAPRMALEIKDVRGVPTGPSTMVSKRALRVREGLLGTAKILDSAKVVDKLLNSDDPIFKRLRQIQTADDSKYLIDYLQKPENEHEPYWALARLCFRVGGDGKVAPLLAKDLLSTVPLRDQTKTWAEKFSSLGNFDRAVVNRMILEDVYGPEAISPGNEPGQTTEEKG